MTTEWFLGGLIILTMAAVIIMALTNRRGTSAASNDEYKSIRANNARNRDRDRR